MDKQQLEQLPCISFNLKKAVRVVNRIYDQYFAEAGLTSGQFSILHVVNIQDVATNKSLQGVLVLDQTTLTRNIKPLLREGFLSMIASPSDRRQKEIRLTASGKEKYREAKELWLQAQQHMYTELGQDVGQQLIKLSSVIVELG